MTALLIIIAAIVLLFAGYVFYGSWLAKQWGIDPAKKTPAKEMPDGVDYVEAKPAVLMGHHFSSLYRWQIYILTSCETFERDYGRRADKVRRLYNGMIKCGYYQYFRNPETRNQTKTRKDPQP